MRAQWADRARAAAPRRRVLLCALRLTGNRRARAAPRIAAAACKRGGSLTILSRGRGVTDGRPGPNRDRPAPTGRATPHDRQNRQRQVDRGPRHRANRPAARPIRIGRPWPRPPSGSQGSHVTVWFCVDPRLPVHCRFHLNGEMSEWLKEHAWKACVGETLPRVRIPLSPPIFDFREIP
jgi:hypothetical protein